MEDTLIERIATITSNHPPQRLALAATFRRLFADAHIPHRDSGEDHVKLEHTAGELVAFKNLANEMTVAIAGGAPVRLYFDNDGSLFRFTRDPNDVRMDRLAYEGLVRLTQYRNFSAVSLTGRRAPRPPAR